MSGRAAAMASVARARGGGRGKAPPSTTSANASPSAASSSASEPGGPHLRSYLLKNYKEGVLSAKQVCNIAYLSTQAGARG
eukprot:4214305-Alexandrium_andersonii.AAC.1